MRHSSADFFLTIVTVTFVDLALLLLLFLLCYRITCVFVRRSLQTVCLRFGANFVLECDVWGSILYFLF